MMSCTLWRLVYITRNQIELLIAYSEIFLRAHLLLRILTIFCLYKHCILNSEMSKTNPFKKRFSCYNIIRKIQMYIRETLI